MEDANPRPRTVLMDKITALIQKNGWTQLEAAKHCSATQPRINELLRGRTPWPAGACGAASALRGIQKTVSARFQVYFRPVAQ